jgi:NADPH-dependent curcumin reductase
VAFNRQIRLRSRPAGMPERDNFDIVDAALRAAEDGEVLGKNLFLSVDPYMRSRMNEGRSYLPAIPLHGVIESGNIARVISSKNACFKPGDLVSGYGGWEEYSLYSGPALRKIDVELAPAEAFLGVLGMPGATAYLGVLDFGRPKPGETLVVSAASGAVGSVAGQIAKIKGARVVGIAGGPEKCRYVVELLGFDHCVDHREPSLPAALADACPKGVDVDFENVGGAILDAVFPLLNDFARIALCGLITRYNDSYVMPGPDLKSILTRRIAISPFVVTDHRERFPNLLRDISGWVREGRIKHREHVIEGLENAPGALVDLLCGRNFGKVVIRLVE